MEHWKRSLVKAVTYRAGGLVATFCVAWALTGRMDMAGLIGLGDTLVKIGVYYFHERVWLKVGYGRAKAADYEI